MNQILEFRKQKPALSIGNPSEKIGSFSLMAAIGEIAAKTIRRQ